MNKSINIYLYTSLADLPTSDTDSTQGVAVQISTISTALYIEALSTELGLTSCDLARQGPDYTPNSSEELVTIISTNARANYIVRSYC